MGKTFQGNLAHLVEKQGSAVGQLSRGIAGFRLPARCPGRRSLNGQSPDKRLDVALRFTRAVIEKRGGVSDQEVYELSEYAASVDEAARQQLFPGAKCRPPRQDAAATPSHRKSSD